MDTPINVSGSPSRTAHVGAADAFAPALGYALVSLYWTVGGTWPDDPWWVH